MSDLPSALRAGASPVAGRGRTPAPQRSSSNVSRMSDMLPTRRSSASTLSNLPDEPTRRYTYGRRDVSPPESDITSPTSPTWGTARPTSYMIPPVPALPSLSESSPYEPVSPVTPQGAHYKTKSARPQSFIGRLASVRNGRLVKKGQYGVLPEEDAERGFRSDTRHRRLDSEDDAENIGFDISGFDGPKIELHEMSRNPDLAVGLHSEGLLGRGMGTVLSASIVPSNDSAQQRPLVDSKAKMAVQREAQKTGEIVAVEEGAVDISNLGGSQYSRSNTMTTMEQPDSKNTQKSYFFPEDPEKPSWRPHSMRWPYITFLILVALALAALQEILLQLSMRQAEKGSGLIEYTRPQEVSTTAYFCWKYLGTMVLVTYGVLWQISDFEVKRLEPYYQLSTRVGAKAGDSLNVDYLTSMTYLIPLLAIRRKQWAVVFSALATLVAGGLLPVLQSASIFTTPKHSTISEKKFVRINPIWSRALTGSLGLVALLGISLAVSLRRTSGLLTDPKGIAGVCSISTKSHILTDFKGLDTATNDVIHTKLRTRRYNLHKSSLWQGEYIRSDEKHTQPGKVENPLPLMLRLTAGGPYMAYIVAFAVIIPVFIFVPAANFVTEKVPWLLTALAAVIKLIWGTLDMSVRVVEPYFLLSRRHAPPKTLTLDYTGTVPGFISVKSSLNGHWLVAIVGLGALLAEVLTVSVTSFTVDGRKFIAGHGGDGSADNDRANSSETFRSFWVSFGLSLFILLYLFVVAGIVYLRRRHKFLPRQPGSIAGVLAYVHQSRMLVDFVDTERLNSGEMTRHLEKFGKTYALGWFNGRDGEDHMGIDQEPIMASYKHGYDWKKARIAGDAVGGWEYF